MFVSKYIFRSLEDLSVNFNRNFSIVIDFLFFVFDGFTYEEKVNILKKCPLLKDKIQEREEAKTDKSFEEISEEIKISINPLLEERLVNLILECEKLQTVSDAIEFLLFVYSLIEKDLISDLIIQYSIETISNSNYEYLNTEIPNKDYDRPDPFHVSPNIPDKFSLIIGNPF